MDPSKSQKGDAAVLFTAARLTNAGIVILRPESDSLPFDIGIYRHGKLIRLQVKKAGLLASGRWDIPVRHTVVKITGAVTKKYDPNDIDYIVGVVIETGDIYFLPISVVGMIKASLQVDPNRVSKSRAWQRKVNPEDFRNQILLGDELLKI